ncbi:monofunctional biosynthetic peptidoglycan transglycosylase [Agrobacterium larrymoorei]|uniref:Biosynthetic peptidoglycan transglycosylase n=1 Tax=Agrobacterium larrymoorei TaxID=160699 RepID=A0A4D7DM56_9HYPH|nr:monofunctional biosynthetic peptidoglycan transglycosylase [Agrobacterium larrymoorei]QYA07800.1 monofunctional biosynthetic peptidoglycan transglycosylase [Agrobacterium larrymoorei]
MVHAEYERLDLNQWGRDLSSTPDSETDYEARPEDGSKPKVDVRNLVKRVVIFFVALFILPYLLIPVYALPFIRPVSTLMLADLVTFQGYDRRWVPLEDISPRLVQSVMMSEDGQFCSHGGVDWNQMQTVVNSALEGESTRGASTIPMQTSKNLFLWNGRSFIRKGLELPLAVVSDFVWSKKRMMEIYLNIAEWGPGIYGIEAAAQHHFKVPASKLSSRQAALLAVALPNPIDRVASKPGRGMQRLAGLIERRARGSGAYVGCVLN